jgi:hypothetical protein
VLDGSENGHAVSAYLQIAELVLRATRRPMTPRAILFEARKRDLMPHTLHGETQHKTLQARLSEDILQRRDHSPFFRTKPGQFFLTQFLTDESIPLEYRQRITARRRTRDLSRGEALCVHVEHVKRVLGQNNSISGSAFCEGVVSGSFEFSYCAKPSPDLAQVWALAFMRRGDEILCHRAGRYRDDRDSFAHRQTLTFSTSVVESDHTLFDDGCLGISSSAFAAISTDLDIPRTYGGGVELEFRRSTRLACWSGPASEENALLIFVEFEPPSWFEPIGRRLSLNDIHWIDITVPPNNLDDFDPWSKTLLLNLMEQTATQRKRDDAASKNSTRNGNRQHKVGNRL